MSKAVAKRVQEFAAGRQCARRALRELGVIDAPIRVALDRQPVWPQGIVGSITHTAGLCAAVVAERKRLVALGLDSEVVGAVKPELWPTICAAQELAWVGTLSPPQRPAAVTFIFSAKEAFYKCQYPLLGEALGFHDLWVIPCAWGSASGTFAVRPLRPIAILEVPEGSYRFHEEFVSTGVGVPNPAAARS